MLENIGVSGLGVKAKLDSDRIDIAPGERILVLDRTRTGKNPLLPAITGHWPWGSGKVKLPGDGRAMFLGPKPYFPKGSLRATLAFPQKPSMVSDSDATAALDRVGLGHLKRSLDRTARWWRKLSPDDQMRLALARLLVQKPKWVFAEGIIDSVAEDLRDLMQSIFENELAETALISVSRCNMHSPLCRRVIHLTSDGPHETKAA